MTVGSLRVVVVDDESLARERIVGLLAGEPGVRLVAECGSGREALDVLRRESTDLVFLDVQMPGMSGLDVLRALGPERTPAVVFVTAYDEHAVQAFELHALDYLLKPFDDRRFAKALQRARTWVESGRMLREFAARVSALLGDGEAPRSTAGPVSGPEEALDRLVVKEGERSILLPVERIDWIEAANYYVVVHAGPRTYVVRDTLGRLERQLGRRFVRIHRATIVNLDRVAEFQRLFHGDFAVLLADGTELKLSRTYRSLVEARLGRPI